MADPSIAELEARLASASAPPVDPIARIDALTSLAWALRNDDYARAHALAGEARGSAIEHGYPLGQARAARTMGMTLQGANVMPAVVAYAEEAKRLFDEVDDPAGRAGSRDFLASIYEYLGELAVALDLALDALSIARQLGDPIRLGYALSSVGGILAGSNQIDAGVERLKEALEIFEKVPDYAGVATICTRLSKALKKAGRREEALKYAQKSRDVALQWQGEWALATALSIMAEIEDEQGHAAEGERLYREAIAATTTDAVRNLLGANIQIALGRLLIRKGALVEAERELEDGLRRIVGDTVSIVIESDAHEALAELSERQGQLAKAIDHLKKAQGLRAQIAQRDARNMLAQVEARATMEAAKKDAEIHKLRFVELHSMQSKLVEAEKRALLGTLAAGAAHELNTPLGVLRSNTELAATASARLMKVLAEAPELGPQVTKLVSALESSRQSTDQAVQRIATVAESFKRFTQLDQAEVRSFDVREGLESALALLRPGIPDTIALERKFEEVPKISAWPRELNQAFLTVLQNAAQAIDGEGVVSAETSATQAEVWVRIRDNGRGMTADKAARLFDMAWSEEGARTKMRMGLCAAYATVQRHGGELGVQSVVGQGTTVTFRFPIPAR